MTMIPLAKSVYICDDILVDPVRVKPHLIGILNSIRPPTFPHILKKLNVFAQMRGGSGRVECIVRVVNAADGSVVFESSPHAMSFSDRLETQYFILRVTNVGLQKPGEYWVELWCEGVFLDDAVLQVLGEDLK